MSSSYGSGNRIPKGYEQGQLQQFTPEMMKLFQHMMGQLGPDSFLSKIAGGDEAAFGQLEAPALKQFSGLQGNIASRFSGQGGGRGPLSSRHSSGFQNTMNQASSDFAQQLQSNRMGLQSQALKDMQSMGNQLLGQRPYEQFLTKKQDKSSFLENLFTPENIEMALKVAMMFL